MRHVRRHGENNSSKYALINQNNIVVNVIMYSQDSRWHVPQNHRLIKADYVNIGDFYDESHNKFVSVSTIL